MCVCVWGGCLGVLGLQLVTQAWLGERAVCGLQSRPLARRRPQHTAAPAPALAPSPIAGSDGTGMAHTGRLPLAGAEIWLTVIRRGPATKLRTHRHTLACEPTTKPLATSAHHQQTHPAGAAVDLPQRDGPRRQNRRRLLRPAVWQDCIQPASRHPARVAHDRPAQRRGGCAGVQRARSSPRRCRAQGLGNSH